jgi:predicted DNA-binding ribbon-helix-helix protein
MHAGFINRNGTGGTPTMKSSVIKRSIVIEGHKTSVSLENEFWDAMKTIARGRRLTLSELARQIDSTRQHGNLSSAIRLFVLRYYRDQLSEYDKAGRTRAILANVISPIAS